MIQTKPKQQNRTDRTGKREHTISRGIKGEQHNSEKVSKIQRIKKKKTEILITRFLERIKNAEKNKTSNNNFKKRNEKNEQTMKSKHC